MQENQQMVFLSDGAENVRRVQEYLHPFNEYLIDWFHITMRITVLQQQTKALQAERPQLGDEVSAQLQSIKHLLWHGNVEEALERQDRLLLDLDLIRARSAAGAKVADGLIEFETYIRNNQEFIRTLASGDGKEKQSARPLWNRPSIKWSAGALSRNSK